MGTPVEGRPVVSPGWSSLGEPGLEVGAGGQSGEVLAGVGVKGARLGVGAGEGGDVVGGDVGLLGGKAAGLHGEGAGVADGPHALHCAGAAALIDLDKPVCVGGDAGDRSPAQARQREDAVDPQGAARPGSERGCWRGPA
jgi:hypothetical protein